MGPPHSPTPAAGTGGSIPWAQDEVLFWSGAGISVDGPTYGPVGRALTDRALDLYLRDDTAGVIRDLYSAISVSNAEFRPRLETVLDALVEAYGIEVLADVLSDLEQAEPNQHHEFFADHLRAGGSHVTANFDTCIERARPPEPRARSPIHFHGSLTSNDPLALERLGARLRVIENGFDPRLRAALDEAVMSPSIRAVVFVGYSGSDFFDATPYLLDRIEHLKNRTVVWYEYAATDLEWLDEPAAGAIGLLAGLTDAGIAIRRVRGRLGDLLDAFRAAWDMPLARPVDPPPAQPPAWAPTTPRSDRDRERASFATFAALGFRAGVIAAAAREQPWSSQAWDQLADAYWGAGRYSEALAAWESAYPGSTPYERARRHERRGAILWIRGEFLAAERHLWSGVRRWCRPDSEAGPLAAAKLLESYGRVIEHMGRSPETRFLVRRSRRAYVTARAKTIMEQLEGSEGVALRAGLSNVVAFLDGTPDDGFPHHIAAFEEAEALHAWLNFRHGRLRQRVEVDGAAVAPGEYEQLIRAQAAIGASADVARVLLIPGAVDHVSPRAIRWAFRPIEMTRWHRARLVLGLLTLRALARLRGRRGTRSPDARDAPPLDGAVFESQPGR